MFSENVTPLPRRIRGGMLTLSQQATQRLMVFNALERGELQVADAAALLGRSVRQTQRLRTAYRQRGAASACSGWISTPGTGTTPGLPVATLGSAPMCSNAGSGGTTPGAWRV